MTAATVHTEVDHAMDHIVAGLRTDADQDRPAHYFSLFRFSHTPAGETGHVLFVCDAAAALGSVITVWTDNPRLVDVCIPRFAPGAWKDHLDAAVTREASFERSGLAVASRLSYQIVAGDWTCELTWSDLAAPIWASGPVPSGLAFRISSLMIEAASFSAVLNGEVVGGEVYPNPVWVPWVGKPLSSALIALSEVIVSESEEATA